MRVLLSWNVGPNSVLILGDDYTGGIALRVNGNRDDLPRGNAVELTEKLTQFLATSEPCPRCGHARIEHFTLWTGAGKLYGCAHGTDKGQAGAWHLAEGLPCDCTGVPE